jgi:hypothetical protein
VDNSSIRVFIGLIGQVSNMNISFVPEQSTICAMTCPLRVGGLVRFIRNRRALRTLLALIAVLPCLTSVADAQALGNHLWNLRENTQPFFDNNVPYVSPWEGAYGKFYDDGYGMFVGPPPYDGDFLWGNASTTGNSADGSLSLIRGVDTQFDAWTYLYVPTPTTISLTGDGDCVPTWFLNYQFGSPQQFPLGDPASINLSAGWNRLDITGYNQSDGFSFESGALASQVGSMNTLPVPEPSTISALASFLMVGASVWLIRRGKLARTMLMQFAVPDGTPFHGGECGSGNHIGGCFPQAGEGLASVDYSRQHVPARSVAPAGCPRRGIRA